MSVSDKLTIKETSLFKRAMKCYENKQYKNGVKFVNQILANPKYAEHGETLALKGLLYYCIGKREEAYEYVKKGLKVEVKSYLCWHTYGILHRSDKNYEEAIKCFRNALRWESSAQILQDLSILQVQIRDLEGYLDTRAKLFQVAPTHRAAWVGFAIASHLNKDFETCLKILETFRKNLTATYSSYSLNEYSELLLYENLVIEESGDLKRAVEHLTEYQNDILDKVSLLESFARINLSVKNYTDAENYINQLLERNSEKMTYYYWLFEALGLETDEERYKTLNNLSKTLPRARLPKRMSLDYVHGDQFSKEVGIYLQTELRRGVLALFVDIKLLYHDNKKAAIVENLVLDFKQCLMNNAVLVERSLQPEPPTTLLWIYYFLAQHFCYFKNFEEALRYIELAICHTPTLPDLYIIKGKIYKKAGNFELAADWLMEASTLDPTDRCINSKCACYHLKANQIKKSADIISMFMLDNVNITESLSEMQCLWYLLECALAYERLGMFGEALRKCHEIERHFDQFYQDQFDFHSFCLRGMTLRPYVDLLRYEEEVRDHGFYKKAAHCAIRIYIRLYDAPKKVDNAESTKEATALTSSELKKLKNKERKAKKKAELAKVCDEKQETKSKARVDEKILLDSHPDCHDPELLEKTATPLEDAMRFLLPLKIFCEHDVRTYLAAFEIYYRKGKILLMLQAIKRGCSINEEHPLLHEMVIRFTLLVEKVKSDGILQFPLTEVVDTQMEPIWRGRSVVEVNNDYLRRHQTSFPGLVQAARCLYLIDNSKQTAAVELCTAAVVDKTIKYVTIEECARVANYMRYGLFGHCEREVIDNFVNKCHQKFPLACVFMPPEAPITNVS